MGLGPLHTGRLVRALLAGLAAASLLAGACGSDDDEDEGTEATATTGTTGTTAAGGGEAKAITIKGFAFAPTPLVVPKGTEVTITNSDDATHTATADDGSFDTGELNKGDAKPVTLSEEGEIAYHCNIHDSMKGVIRVEG